MCSATGVASPSCCFTPVCVCLPSLLPPPHPRCLHMHARKKPWPCSLRSVSVLPTGLLAVAMIPLIAIAGIVQMAMLTGGYGDNDVSLFFFFVRMKKRFFYFYII